MNDRQHRDGGWNSLVTFVVSLLAGAASIYIGALIVLDVSVFGTAVFAALVGSIVWGVVSFFTDWIPIAGSIITLFVWLGAINWVYPGGWFVAAQIALFAWIASLIILYAASIMGLTDKAVGVPGS